MVLGIPGDIVWFEHGATSAPFRIARPLLRPPFLAGGGKARKKCNGNDDEPCGGSEAAKNQHGRRNHPSPTWNPLQIRPSQPEQEQDGRKTNNAGPLP